MGGHRTQDDIVVVCEAGALVLILARIVNYVSNKKELWAYTSEPMSQHLKMALE